MHIAIWGNQPCQAQTSGTGSGGVTYVWQDVWHDTTPNLNFNAFGDLTNYNGNWYMVFRSAIGHGIPLEGAQGGEIRVLESANGQNWSSVALLSDSGADLRDPKISVTPSNQLLISAGSISQSGVTPVQSVAWLSSDGSNWSQGLSTGDYDWWTWRTVWHNGVGYGISYGPNNTDPNWKYDLTTQLVTTTDGIHYNPLVLPLTPTGQQSDEAGLTFLPNGTAVALIRRDGAATSTVGTATGSYTNWAFQDANLQLESPDLLTLPDGRIVAAGRGSDAGQMDTELCWLDPTTATLTPFLILPEPSSLFGYPVGETGYPGLAWNNNQLWVNYYVGNNAGGDIYLAQVSIPSVPEPATLGLLLVGTVTGTGICWARRRRKIAGRC